MKRIFVYAFLLILSGALCLGGSVANAQSDTEFFQQQMQLAQQGNAEAQFYVGVCYGNGSGVAQNDTEAFRWFLMSAQQGIPESQLNVGILYEYGRGVAQNYTEAFNWYLKAAEQGVGKAQHNVATLYFDGNGVARNYSEAFKWYTKAAEQGLAPAQCGLGKCYGEGKGVAQNYAESFNWYLKAAEQGDVASQYDVGLYYDRGYGVAQNYSEAFRWYMAAAEQGFGEAQNSVGVLYRDGKGVGQNYSEAVKWFLSAAQQGLSNAQYNVGWSYYYGHGVAQNYAEAVRWFNASMDQGYANAYDRMAEAYMLGRGVAQNQSKAFELVNRAIQLKPDEPLFYDTKGSFYAMLGDDNHAVEMWNKIISIDPQFPYEKPTGFVKYIMENFDVNLPSGSGGNTALAQNSSTTTSGSSSQSSGSSTSTYNGGAGSSAGSYQNSGSQQTQSTVVSDVDKNIPSSNRKNENTFAVIIANENYTNEAEVPYALNDGKVFSEYCSGAFGLPESNIHLVENATLNAIRDEVDWASSVMNAYGGDAKVIFYYAGHGIPDESTKSAYLLPVDGRGSNTKTGYALEELYGELGKYPAKSVTVFLDACFSGAKRDGDMMASARGVAIKVNPTDPVGNMVVFSASAGDETAYPYDDQGHGLFTYYLLKKLQDTKGSVSLGDLADYVTTQVKRQSIVINRKSQTPTVIPSSSMSSTWRSETLK